ncbi:Type IV fimbrial assembly, ATPase PilB OS=Hyalangium minutum GN=DB31_0730 PE=4 SV=1 [Gemmataceae bacterium]|nr:Type IV fimbrial assembly, ATPase PilB OS=Hyalangium minutum GN=DB31_0730 PE=4 SV=1 [Gemmataceae bacterium]VTT99199.1 Type IV fimbrial assembly, ATPase PilB OS=Hyalangium minutum GN=DB31_0730 PE=4 SV=1 [Gemmataceae bacterium]
MLFAFKCPKQWEKLKGTDNPLVRDCDACQKKVYYCLTQQEARDHAQQGDCVAVQPGLSRFPNDLSREYPADVFEDTRIVMGMLAGYDEPEPRRPWWKFW